MLDAHPQPAGGDRDLVVRCIEACVDCAATCTSCADANLGESDVPALVRCVRRCLDCADVPDNVDLARQAFAAINRRDLHALLALMDPEVVARPRILSVEGGALRGHDGI